MLQEMRWVSVNLEALVNARAPRPRPNLFWINVDTSMRFTTLFLLLVLGPAMAWAQGSPTWQQRVSYTMDISVRPDVHQYDGIQKLVYENNSPDTLHHVYYHLYFNAFQPTSMMAERNRHLPDPDGRTAPRIFNLKPDEIGYHRVTSLQQDGRPTAFELHDTVLKVTLVEPIPPGGSSVFDMEYTSQVPLQTRRSGRDSREGVDFSMSQWYPKMAAYDERGWHADPYVGREFYAPFGTFDVSITIDSSYVLGATGVLQNPDEIGHGYGLDSLQGAATDAARLTWHFVAENVHDFAWVADEDYIHERFDGPFDIDLHLLYLPDVADRWKHMREDTYNIMEYLSNRAGIYAYPQFTVAQAGDGGMEYPMINFITGVRSRGSLAGVTAHEAAHEWFYAMLGSNEADYAWMDEGFTSYISGEAMAALFPRGTAGYSGAALSVMAINALGHGERLNTPSDWFEKNGAYGTAAYSGGAMIADMLGYVMGDSLRDEWMREYVRRFTFKHPNPYDVEKVAEDVSGLRLDWFFEQFTNDTKPLDYAVVDLSARPSGNGGYEMSLTLERKTPVVMPVDVRVDLADGTTLWVTIPTNEMLGAKPVPADWIVAQAWPWTYPTYRLTAPVSARPVRASLDPNGRTPEINRLNNTSSFPVNLRFLQPSSPDWFTYDVGWSPTVHYGSAWGPGIGIQAHGKALFDRHETFASIHLWPQVLSSGGDEPTSARLSTGNMPEDGEEPMVSALDGIDWHLSYSDALPALGLSARWGGSSQRAMGVMQQTVWLQHRIAPYRGPVQTTARVGLVHHSRTSDRAYAPISTESIFPEGHLTMAQIQFEATSATGYVQANVSLGGYQSGRDKDATVGFSATRVELLAEKRLRVGILGIAASIGAGFGSADLHPSQQFRLGGLSEWQAWENTTTRMAGEVFEHATADAHLSALGATGPVAYLLAAGGQAPVGDGLVAYNDRPGDFYGTPRGTSMIGARLDLNLPNPARRGLLSPLSYGIYSGVGTTWFTAATAPAEDHLYASLSDATVLADAGVRFGYAFADLRSLARWTGQSRFLRGLELDVRLPLWVSEPSLLDADADAIAMRWLVGLRVR
jgi:hypothetical protein